MYSFFHPLVLRTANFFCFFPLFLFFSCFVLVLYTSPLTPAYHPHSHSLSLSLCLSLSLSLSLSVSFSLSVSLSRSLSLSVLVLYSPRSFEAFQHWPFSLTETRLTGLSRIVVLLSLCPGQRPKPVLSRNPTGLFLYIVYMYGI